MTRSSLQLAESTTMSTRRTLHVLGLALRYARPFAARFAVKAGLLLLSIAILLVIPLPAKILIDHVVLARPVASDHNPLVREPLLWLGLTDPSAIFWATAALLGVLLLLAGAIGSGGTEREPAEAWLGSGQDTATRTENEINAGFSLIGGLLGLFDYFVTIRLTQDLNHHYRRQLFARIHALPYAAFDEARIGDAIYRVLYDTPAITNTVYRLILTPIGAPVSILASALLLRIAFGDHPPIYLSACAMLPVSLVVGILVGGVLRRREGRSRRAGASVTTTAEESLSNVVVTQAFGAEHRERARFDSASWRSFTEFRRLVAAGMAGGIGGFVLAAPFAIAAVGYILHLLATEVITPGDLSLVFGYFFAIATPAVDLGALWPRIQGSAVGLHRVFHVLERLPAELDDANRPALAPIRERVAFEHVSFAFDGAPVLHDVSFEARVGTITAIVGPAGAGKTTLVSLIPRFHEPDAGRVLADGTAVAEVRLASVRSQVAFAFQESVLFSGSIEENIRFGYLDAGEQDVWRAARQALADDFIRALPQGYATRLGRAGTKLSVGQKQRLQLARALVRPAPVLILDEPTASLDPETEAALVRALRAASRERIVLVVTHRLSTVAEADQILFLDGGRIVERGAHAALVARAGGAYRRFWELQLRGDGASASGRLPSAM
jgi:ABC-type multidrug transport system fused ATPase/permease subunit